MRALRQLVLPLASLTIAALIGPGPLLGQEEWRGPQDPCKVRAGHFLVTGATNHLRIAVESGDPNRREGRLREAHRVLMDAIENKGQDDNPGAWYFLGRYYVYVGDGWGADSAFSKVLETNPECAADIAVYVDELAPSVRADAIEAWQSGHVDSAAVLFQLARALMPQDAEIPYFMSMMYSNAGQFDSAFKYVQIGNELAGDDPDLTRRKRQAMLDIARGYEALAFEDPAAMQIIESRMQRDTLMRAVARDSVLLANLIAQWAGKPLRPDVQQAVARDSTRLADRLAAARAALPAAIEAMQRDSTAVDGAIGPALEAYEVYLGEFPDDTDTKLRLLRRYSMAGRAGQMEVLVTELSTDQSIELIDLSQVGVSLFNDGHPEASVRLLGAVTTRNPYLRTALYTMCRAYYALQDQESLKSTAAALLAVDPMSPQNLRMMAAAYDLARNADSTRYWVAQADTGVGWSVRITQMVTMGPRTVINGTVSNISGRPAEPLTLEFSFIDESGAVIATATAEIPALARGGREALAVETDQTGAVAWRYRRVQ
jgi:tetratricopeptide (TPR) repeat protein